jgi:acetyltransferase-like isoleucine patch superfamily enzyme
MNYLSKNQLKKMNFKSLGKNVLISKNASIIKPEEMIIGDNTRVDDFSLLYGSIDIGRNVHITPMCLMGAGNTNITIGDFCTLAYGVKVFSQSDDYMNGYMTGSTVDIRLKKDTCKKVIFEKFVIIGANSIIFPGCILKEGTAIGACSLVNKNTKSWSLYYGVPAKFIKKRKKILKTKIQII